MADSYKDLIRRWTDAINAGKLERLDEIVKPGFVRHSEATPGVVVESLDDFKAFDRESRKVYGDYRVTTGTLIEEDDKVAFWAKFDGVQIGPLGPFPATGKPISGDMGGYFRIEDGMIAELWITWDNLAGLVQLGHLPPMG